MLKSDILHYEKEQEMLEEKRKKCAEYDAALEAARKKNPGMTFEECEALRAEITGEKPWGTYQ